MGGKVTTYNFEDEMYSLTRVWYIGVFIPLFTYQKYEIQAHVTTGVRMPSQESTNFFLGKVRSHLESIANLRPDECLLKSFKSISTNHSGSNLIYVNSENKQLNHR